MEDFMNGSELRQRFLERLLEQIKEETFPSVTMMDLVETGLSTREQFQEYAEVLLEKIESSRYPSIPMLERFERVVTQLELPRA
jgi:hypothetical protein